ncbi:MAG: hypothetical protein J1E77_08825 [Prevotella sp.]|nr:hypothetical protein [Prevotella sp.]
MNGINSPRYTREPLYSLAQQIEISQVSSVQVKHNASILQYVCNVVFTTMRCKDRNKNPNYKEIDEKIKLKYWKNRKNRKIEKLGTFLFIEI